MIFEVLLNAAALLGPKEDGGNGALSVTMAGWEFPINGVVESIGIASKCLKDIRLGNYRTI